MTKTKPSPTIPAVQDPTTTVRVSDHDELDVWVTGQGTPVVLSHGAFWPDLLGPLMEELAGRYDYQVVHYHRRGYSGKPTEPIDFSAHALDIVKILDAIGIEKAHVFGHSYAANLVLDLTAEFPDRVRSVVAVEHTVGAAEETLSGAVEAVGRVVDTYQSGDGRRAASDFLALFGIAVDFVDQIPSGCIDTFFQVDLPAFGAMEIDLAKLRDSGTTVLSMRSSDASPVFVEASAGLREVAPQAREMVVPDSDHFFSTRQPAETAAVLDKWLGGLDD